MAILLITHAMGVVAEVAQRVVVMYAGMVVEEATVEELFANPRHPYTQGLIRSIPRIDTRRCTRHAARADPGTVPKLIHAPPRLPLRSNRCKHAASRTPAVAADARPARPVCPRPFGALHLRHPCLIRTRRPGRHRARWPHHERGVAAACRDLHKHYPHRRRPGSAARVERVHAVGGVSFEHRSRRDPRPGRRIRLRQVHHRPLPPAPGRAQRSGTHHLRRAATSPTSPAKKSNCAPCAARHADHLPGPVRLPQPPP